jgi:hypothetical protein
VEQVETLAGTQSAPGRPFTDPAYTAADLVAIRVMAEALRRALDTLPGGHRPVTLQLPDVEGRPHRTVVTDDRRLRTTHDLPFVGFFAQRRTGLEFEPLDAVDTELILEFPRHPGILSYSSLELPVGNWGNLIILDAPDAADDWRTSAKHAHAAAELAPRFYRSVRLHTGRFARGLASAALPVLMRTKYYDFQESPPWMGSGCRTRGTRRTHRTNRCFRTLSPNEARCSDDRRQQDP